MRSLFAFSLLLSSVAFAEGAFPIPSVDGKPAIATKDQKGLEVQRSKATANPRCNS